MNDLMAAVYTRTPILFLTTRKTHLNSSLIAFERFHTAQTQAQSESGLYEN